MLKRNLTNECYLDSIVYSLLLGRIRCQKVLA
jgi:hypothetical protein